MRTMVRTTRVHAAVLDARQGVEWLVGIAHGFGAAMPEVRPLKHDVEVATRARTLRYCALQAISDGRVAASWWSVPIGRTVTGFEPAVPPSSYALSRCTFRFVLYETDEHVRYRDGLVLDWTRADDVEADQRHAGTVAKQPRRGRGGRILLADDRSVLLLPQDAQGLARDAAVECTVARSIGTGVLAGLLVSEVTR
ncbi:hypothetical protein GCM10029978_030000 [Actinoallomurus acanthiterrae]